jgi:hypothetical protein
MEIDHVLEQGSSEPALAMPERSVEGSREEDQHDLQIRRMRTNLGRGQSALRSHTIARQLGQRGVGLHSLRGQIDTTTPGGPRSDSAVVDTLDIVGTNCEAVDRADTGNANGTPEDRAPTVALTSPAEGAMLPARRS